ncbi:uncharacterized protein JN550_001007 [Neoarthrinium moseri]|uniref:uncharacterized protein n=1 Tax=Neoarthrinium moseri TaxID=1658444 RepID=UPI001FDE1FB2|nr:uncharacterized protein JN550_001007 [Neoarthrinium moseri]KAI1876935.1 hypothetical protein JN550_001007 [Neoarthrinium moseri]
MAASPASLPARLGFLGLPEEIQKEIFFHCSQCELICLSLVCKRFHELAAAQLYRNFHIVFPDEDDPSFDLPFDGLAGGLDTFVTSEYNYAKHLRDLSLDTLSAGDKGETAYKPYLFSVSCGKFMNTLLLLTLRKATSLDTFRWNIRVELSRPVYKALHNIRSLKNLQVRMQSGPSLYEPPPPLPYNSISCPFGGPASPPNATQWSNIPSAQSTASIGNGAATAPMNFYNVADPFQPSLFSPLPSGPFASTIGPGQFTTYAPPSAVAALPSTFKPPTKARIARKQRETQEPPTIAGFRDLESLAVLDIEDLDLISELETCVRNSASTLRKLRLSFSDYLASQARKPNVDVDPNESDDDDEFQVVPMNANYDDGTGPAKAFRAQEERRAQESVLGRIFDVEHHSLRKAMQTQSEKQPDPSEQPQGDRKNKFLVAIQDVSKRLAENTQQLSLDVHSQKDILDMIALAANMYIADVERETVPETSADSGVEAASGNPVTNTETGLPISDCQAAGETVRLHQATKKGDDDTEPEDIDVAAPEEQLGDEPQEELKEDVAPKNEPFPPSTTVLTPSATNSTANGSPSKVPSAVPSVSAAKDISVDADTLAHLIDPIERRPESTSHRRDKVWDEAIQHELNLAEAELEEAEANAIQQAPVDSGELRRLVSEYVRKTRGIPLESLSLYLIPVKASVLGRAIDLRTLTRVTLLNVGNQATIWTLMAKENKISPLPLREIFTDNVSLPFLHLVSQLDTVEELFMLERGPKYKPESFAPKTKVTLEQIRRAILKKHMPTIKRLIIKNEADGSWDMDEKTMQLICRRGKLLEELAVVMGIRAVHAFLQYLSGLVKLRALHIVSFRNDDTCLSVMREIRRFIADTVSHYPELQLEWIAMGDDNRAERIIRKSDAPKLPKREKGKGKGVAPEPSILDPFPILPSDGWDGSSSEDGDATDDDFETPYLKLNLIERICFYDIWGVRIFEKEIVAARL